MIKKQRIRRTFDTKGALLATTPVFKIYKENDVETVALQGAVLQVMPQEFVAIQGRSGAGKTTLLNLIGGLDIPSAGRVILKGKDIAHMDESERSIYRREHIGIVFQSENLIPFLTALENVMLPMTWSGVPSKEAEARATALLTSMGLDKRLHHKVTQLSGGEAQRVGIAIALANNPDLILADELTGELDTETTQIVMKILRDLHKTEGLTLLVVTHNKRVAFQAQRVLHIHDGLITMPQEVSHE